VKEGLKILLSTRNRKHQQNFSIQQNSSYPDDWCAYRFVLLDWFEELINATPTSNMVVERWRPLLKIEASKRLEANKTRNGSSLLLVPLVPLLKDWARIKKEGVPCDFGDDDICADSEQTGKSLLVELFTVSVIFCSSAEPGSSVSIVSDYGLDDRTIGVRSPTGAEEFSSNLCVQTGSGAHPASCTMGTGGPFPGAKRGRGVTLTTHSI
jgi:hypothetical protein